MEFHAEDGRLRGKSKFQGSLFSKKPYLTCESCNSGWMKKFEDAMDFAKPLFLSQASLKLNERQMRILAVWIANITVLAEYSTKFKEGITIPKTDRAFIKKHFALPDNWCVFAATLDSTKWAACYRHHQLVTGTFSTVAEGQMTLIGRTRFNTQISSFGMGNLFVQTFSCPSPLIVSDYKIAMQSHGLAQIWPVPMRIWPLPKRLAQFPTKLVPDDGEADLVANKFGERLQAMTRRGYWS